MCLALAGVTAIGVAWAQQAPDQVAVQLRNGTIVRGALEDLEGGTLYVRVSLHDQRRLPIGDVALIDRASNASGSPESEARMARGASGLVVLTNGTTLEGTLVDMHGGTGSGDPEKPRTIIVRTKNGAERRLAAARVSRIYMGNFGGTYTDETPVATGAVRVRATERWTDTGVDVRRSQFVGFVTTGKVQLSADAADTASSPGRDRTAATAPMPAIRAGALIGRVGPNGQPFAIGNQTSVPMPEDGRLYLSVNDDELSDNSGAFDVVITPSQTKQ
jgi:small nuclear ribonucleoprotein (snRNP)-like protein